ncbi:MAG: hypothetical protein JJ850_10420 [Kordiimonadaceae bacterium]|nr:hypothetical protein [Kordiimonadaceae bacterium]MBO6569549.1 hypothetical protein [Kordiimonadaceae bacterium]MBO6965024.1 hypothetical protein [Kordiimonadaceae bacterium]
MSAVVYLPGAAPGIDRFEEFRAALPLRVSRARRGFGGYITFDLGAEQGRDAITQEAQFEWHLWVYMCDWDLYKADSRILWRRESDNALAGAVLEMLNGETLTGIEHDETDDCFEFHFSGGFRLHMDPDFYDYDGDDDLFMLFRFGERDALNYSPRKRFYRAA